MKDKRNKLKDITLKEVKKLINNGAKITFIDQMKDKKELGTKYYKTLSTKDQRKIYDMAKDDIMKKYDVKEGRAWELLSLEYLSGDSIDTLFKILKEIGYIKDGHHKKETNI